MYCFVTNYSTCIALLLLNQHVLPCYYWLNMYCFVTTNSTCIALLLLTQHVLIFSTKSTCIALLPLTQHVLACYYLLNMYCFVATNSTCISLLLLTQHVLPCCYLLNIEFHFFLNTLEGHLSYFCLCNIIVGVRQV